MIPPIIIKTLTVVLVPIVVEEVRRYFGNTPTVSKEKEKEEEAKKVENIFSTSFEDIPEKYIEVRTHVRDVTEYNQYHFDVTTAVIKQFDAYNAIPNLPNKTRDDLVKVLNSILKMKKSRIFYSKIWLKKIKREDLPTSQQVYKG